MGNHKFRLSDMMPNAWFYKLKDMGKPRNHNKTSPNKKKEPTFTSTNQAHQQYHHHHPRKSYYFTRELLNPAPVGEKLCSPPSNPKDPEIPSPDPPRKSAKQRIRRRRPTKSSAKLVSSSVSHGCSCRASIESMWTKSDSPDLEYYSSSSSSSSSSSFDCDPEFRCDRALTADTFDGIISKSTTCDYPDDYNADDIVINVDKTSLSRKSDVQAGIDSLTEFELPPIITKPAKFNVKKKESKGIARYRRSLVGSDSEERNGNGSLSVKVIMKENKTYVKEQRTSPVAVRGIALNSPGMRLRINSPRIGSRKVQSNVRKGVSSSSRRSRNLSDSFAIVKASFDPHKDFRESMVEMIVENNIRSSKDLEDLLACYLTLNSDEYHDLIIKVFKQIWFDLTDNPSK